MASSFSSSEEIGRDTSGHALPSGLRLTAANRPVVAQPVPERDIPDQPWRVIALIVMVLVILLTFLWEWKMRTLELVPGDLGANFDRWAELRRQVDKAPRAHGRHRRLAYPVRRHWCVIRARC
jgi:hypothetical protein